jgi:CBS domain-containing protein
VRRLEILSFGREGRRREVFRRSLRDKGQLDLRAHHPKKHEGEIMTVAKSPVVTMAYTTPVYDAIRIMVKEGFRRIPIVDPGTRRLKGIIIATDIVNYLGGGKRFQIIEQKFSGNFFKAINEPVKSIMARKMVSVPVTARVSKAIELMKKHNVGGLPVVDKENHVLAIITERDVMPMFAGKISLAKVVDFMSTKVVTASPATSILEAERIMIEKGFRRLPLISDGKLVGIVTIMDVLKFFGSGHVFEHLRSGTIIQVLQTPIKTIATGGVVTIGAEAEIGKAAKIMQEKNVGALPVVKNKSLIGIITERDFFKLVA